MKKQIYVTFVLSFIMIATLYAQNQKSPVNFPSPNAASLGTFGNIPVNHFTGLPNIEISLYELNDGIVNIPISLRYHLASVRLNSHPGWVGLGWNLESTGAITRQVNGSPDEIKTIDGNEFGYYYNYAKLNVSTWSSKEKLEEYGHDLLWGSPTNYEVMPDVFNFNVFGYSGKFILDHNGEWIVHSDRPMKVIFEPENGGFAHINDLRNDIRYNIPSPTSNTINYFNEFKLIAEDGTIFEFGGINATEYSTSYRNPKDSYLIPTTWYLTKIVYPNKRIVEFSYEEGPLICTLANSYSYISYEKDGGGFFSLNPDCSGTSVNFGRRPANGYLIFPVYLKEINTDNQKIVFNRSESEELRYISYDLNYDSFYDGNESFYIYFDNPDELQWQKLDLIEIYYNSSNEIFRKYKFNYNNISSERLKLLSVVEYDPKGKEGQKYTFDYNDNLMAPYCSDKLDHWGFFNNYDVSQFNPGTIQEWINMYPSTREPDPTAESNKFEVLKKIHYPAGGYTQFLYGPHNYRKVVNKSRSGLINLLSNNIAGGLRIQKIENYDEDATLINSTNYYYITGYNGISDPSNLPSSGILSSQNQYYWPNFQGKDLDDNPFIYDLFTSNSLLNSPFDDASHITYTEVVEKVDGLGYTKFTYTNYDVDINGENHLDEVALDYIDAERSLYSPYTSKALERGKLLSTMIYDENNRLVKQTTNVYEKSSTKYVRAIFSEHFNICSGVTASAQSWFGTSYKYYIYNYNLIQTDEYLYDTENSSKYAFQRTNINYNDINLVESIENIGSDFTRYKKFKYPNDYTSSVSTVINQMVGNHIVSNVIEEQIWQLNPDNSKSLISGTLKQFSSYGDEGNIIQPSHLYLLETSSKISETLFGESFSSIPPYSSFNPNSDYYKLNSIFHFDEMGNLVEYTQNGITTSYLYGYNNTLPILKAVGATAESLNNLVQNFTGVTNLSEQELANIRNDLDQALISDYVYDPLKGMTSETGPDNIKLTYEYDDFGRLKLVKDHNGDILKRYTYQYRVQ